MENEDIQNIEVENSNDVGFAQINNEIIDNTELSSDARMLLITLLRHSEKFKINKRSLKTRLGFGREKLDKAIKQLKTFGYLIVTPVKSLETGEFIGYKWKTDRNPRLVKSSETLENRKPVKPEAGYTGSRSTRLPYQNTNHQNTNHQNTNDQYLCGMPETGTPAQSNPTENIPSNFEQKQKILVLSDAFEKETESNQIAKFLLSFCRFIKTGDQRKDLRKETIIGVRSEAKRLIEKKITLDQLNQFERWYKTTFAGEKRENGQVYGYGYIRENWSAFEAACNVQGGVGIHMPAKTSDSRHEIKFSADGNIVEIWNKQTGSLFRRMSIAQYQEAFGGGAK